MAVIALGFEMRTSSLHLALRQLKNTDLCKNDDAQNEETSLLFCPQIKPTHIAVFTTAEESVGVVWYCDHLVSGARVTGELVVVGPFRIIQIYNTFC